MKFATWNGYRAKVAAENDSRELSVQFAMWIINKEIKFSV